MFRGTVARIHLMLLRGGVEFDDEAGRKYPRAAALPVVGPRQ